MHTTHTYTHTLSFLKPRNGVFPTTLSVFITKVMFWGMGRVGRAETKETSP